MTLSDLLSRWRADPSIGPNFSTWETIPRRQPRFAPFPEDLHPTLRESLRSAGIRQLYLHQEKVWQLIKRKQHTAIVTGTASGKTLAYNLPVLDQLYQDPGLRALYLFPTKALAHDQLEVLHELGPLPAASYDGDTPARDRPGIRRRAHLVISNPDMLHLGILPHHTEWSLFFEQLRFVVLDEMHTYRGVFGSHVANVIRRLKRTASHYGSEPTFITTSATIGNPQELAEQLIEEPVELVDEDTSSRGEKHFLVYNPPIVDQKLGLRAGMQRESERLVRDALACQLQTILFGRSRKSVEFMISRLRETSGLPQAALQAYRSGYLPAQRREIEAGLRSGRIRLAAATNALELGIDIGGMDAAVLAGYPGTISSTWQQAGRSGRSDQPSVSVLVVSSQPLDQYLAHNPDYLLKRSPERALINPDNLLILLTHIQCAAFELPFQAGDAFGKLSPELTGQFLAYLSEAGFLHHSRDSFYWMKDSYPAGEFSLRTTSPDQVILRHAVPDQQAEVLGTVDSESAPWMVHPGAVYLHQGETYLVDELDLDHLTADLVTAAPAYYTEPQKETSVQCLEKVDSKTIPGGSKHLGELKITTRVVGFKKISWTDYQPLGQEPLDLPPSEMDTTGFWIALNSTMIDRLESAGSWNSANLDYGPDWQEHRLAVLERDQSSCQVCGQRLSPAQLHVHHLQPLRSFRSLKEANQLDNLLTVCPRCHRRLENVVRVRSGLTGLGYLFHHLAPLLLMCDRHDLGVHIDPESPLENSKPTALLYENIPAGIGFSRVLYQNQELLISQALELVSTCPCQDGCPSCVGPGGELGRGSKPETTAILEELTSTSN
jgi:DEAD/DEAH box helicase domain-containing protein